MEPVIVIGAGLAGSEAAWQLAQRGIPVELREMKPQKMTPAHHSADFGELVCSNSLRSDQLENAVGLLKEELRRCSSLIMACADAHRVEAGGALAVDRYAFSAAITEKFTAAEQALLKEVRNGVENFNAEQKNQLDALIFKLEEQANEQQKEIVTLRGEMLEQRKSAKNQFDELQKAMTGRLESETKLLQEEHTRQLEAIREKEKQLSGELNAEKSKAENLQKQLDELTLVNNSLSTENDKLGKLNSNQADELAAVRAELAEAMKKLEALSNNQDAATQTTENDMNNAEPTPREEVETPAAIEPVGGNITVIQSASENK